jgi:hypothetical protein
LIGPALGAIIAALLYQALRGDSRYKKAPTETIALTREEPELVMMQQSEKAEQHV